MRVACLVPYPLDTVPGQRFRTEQWAPLLAAQGVTVEFFPLLRPETMSILYKPGHLVAKTRDILAGCLARIDFVWRHARDFDVVVVQREAILLGLDWIERALVGRVPVCFDLDDAVWLPNVSRANRWLSFAKGFSKIERIMRMVDSVSAGCQYLADYARRVNPNVLVVPVSIDMARYTPPKRHVQNDVLTVGWTGSVTTVDYLREAFPALARAAKNVRLRVKILGGRIEIPGVDVECIDWRPDIEVDVIRSFDVGLKPSPREEWAKGKCPMKDLQYMALRIPPIATRFGTMLESIEHGRTGFLCDTEDDWVSAITTLADASRREAMGAEAREVVQARYSSTVAAAGFLQALDLARRTFQQRSKD